MAYHACPITSKEHLTFSCATYSFFFKHLRQYCLLDPNGLEITADCMHAKTAHVKWKKQYDVHKTNTLTKGFGSWNDCKDNKLY